MLRGSCMLYGSARLALRSWGGVARLGFFSSAPHGWVWPSASSVQCRLLASSSRRGGAGPRDEDGMRGISLELQYLNGGGAWRLDPRQVSSLMGKSNKQRGGWDASLQLFDAMSQQAPEERNVFIFSAAITACAKRGGGDWRMAGKIFDDMLDSRVEPNVFTFNALITTMAKGGQWKRAVDVFEDMAHFNVEPNVFIFSAVITALGKGGQWEKAEETLKDMVARGMEPNVITFNTLITALGNGGQWEKAEETLKDMVARGMEPNVITFNAVITALGNGGQWEKAEETFHSMTECGCDPNDASYTAIFEALEGNMRSEEADALFRADQNDQLGALQVMEQFQAARGVHKPCLSFTKQRGHDLCIDLHGLSANQARSVVRCCVSDLADMHESGREAVIIVGKGVGHARNKSQEAEVGPALKRLLSDEMKMVCTVDPGNDGVLLLTL